MYYSTANELQKDFNRPSEIERRKWLSKRPFFGKQYYLDTIESKAKKLSQLFENWATTQGFEYEVWFCHRMILISQEALDVIARLERGETVKFTQTDY